MKKTMSIIACVIIGLSLTACANHKQNPVNLDEYISAEKNENDIVIAKVGNKNITKKELMLFLDSEVMTSPHMAKDGFYQSLETLIFFESAYQKALKDGFLIENKDVAQNLNEMKLDNIKELKQNKFDNEIQESFVKSRVYAINLYNSSPEEYAVYKNKIDTAMTYINDLGLRKNSNLDDAEFSLELEKSLKAEFNVQIFENEVEKLIKN